MKVFAGRFGIGQWTFIGQLSEKKWSSSEDSPQGAWDNIVEKMLLEFAEWTSYFPCNDSIVQGILKSKGRGKLSIHFAADQDTMIQFIALFFLSISSVSTEQWQLYAKNLKTIKIQRGNL